VIFPPAVARGRNVNSNTFEKSLNFRRLHPVRRGVALFMWFFSREIAIAVSFEKITFIYILFPRWLAGKRVIRV
jgi:hypothetical protein